MSTTPAGREQTRSSSPQMRCPLCQGEARRALVATDLNRQLSELPFTYGRCCTCDTYFLVDVPPDMGRYYPNEYYELPSAEALDAAAQTERFKVQMLLDHTRPGRLVEIGPGVGVFARAAQNAGFEVTGIEMDARTCEHLRTVVGVSAIESETPDEVLSTLPPSCAIVLWHVIEHLPKPAEVIYQAAFNLEPGGVLAIAAPNPDALQFKLLGGRWAHLDAPRHQFLIPPGTLARRCADAGLRLVSTTTTDPAGLYWNWFGWEYALRRSPRSRPGSRARSALAGLIARMLAPIEMRGHNGCAFTSIFLKSGAE